MLTAANKTTSATVCNTSPNGYLLDRRWQKATTKIRYSVQLVFMVLRWYNLNRGAGIAPRRALFPLLPFGLLAVFRLLLLGFQCDPES
jgi:hypothetical protein